MLEKEPIDIVTNSQIDSPLSSLPDYIFQASKANFEVSQNSKLPEASLVAPLDLTSKILLQIFHQNTQKHDFKVIESHETYATAVYKTSFSFKKLLTCCFEKSSDEDNICAIKMLIGTDEEKSMRKITIKGLSGVN